jgi:hypothetical protein
MDGWIFCVIPIPVQNNFKNTYIISIHEISPRTQWVEIDSARLVNGQQWAAALEPEYGL